MMPSAQPFQMMPGAYLNPFMYPNLICFLFRVLWQMAHRPNTDNQILYRRNQNPHRSNHNPRRKLDKGGNHRVTVDGRHVALN
ncbi:hypothetical protein Gotur_019919, partial [Gossypium turneri]